MEKTDPMDKTEPTDRWFATPEIRIHGLDWGGPAGAPVVLMLHGVAGNAWVWDDVGPRLARALPGHRIVAIDQRDGGDTDHPETGYERTNFFADLLAVHDALGGGPLVLVGHSRGGWLATAFATAHPDRVGRLVLVDPARLTFANETDAGTFYDWVRDGLGPFPSEEAALTWATGEDPAAIWTPVRTRSFLVGFNRDANGALTGKLPKPVVERLRAARTGGEDVTAAIGRLATPTLLLVATRQAPDRMANKMAYAERLPDVTTVQLDGSHFLHTDVPEAVATAIEEFLAPTR
jgi:pimeloyl-ACP methyl ester carboxylesterase